MSEELANAVESGPRPVFLKVISILSFIFLGFQALKLMLGFIVGKLSDDEMIEKKVQLTKLYRMIDDGSDEVTEVIRTSGLVLEQSNDNYWMVQFLTALIVGLGVYGVVNMYNGKKIGFHFYIIYSLVAIGGTYLYLSPELVSMPSLLLEIFFSGLFIFMYSKNLHWMKK